MVDIVLQNNSYLFAIFKKGDKYYQANCLFGAERIYAKDLGYSKKELDRLYDIGNPIVYLKWID